MTKDDLNELKCIQHDLEDALHHLETEGRGDEHMSWIYVASALDELREFICRTETHREHQGQRQRGEIR